MKLRNFIEVCNRISRRYPAIVPAMQTSILMGCGDGIAQIMVERSTLKDYNYVRTAQFAGLGLFLVGPSLGVWYRLLAKLFGKKGSPRGTLKKIILDQCVFAPTFLIIFLTALGTIKGQNMETVVNNIKKNYFDIIIANYKVWPFVQLVNFYFVPVHYQVLLVQSVALFWNTYLSWKTQSEKADH